MRFGDPRDFAACDLGFGDVECDAGSATLRSRLEDFERAALAGDDRADAPMKRRTLFARTRSFGADRLVEKFEIARVTSSGSATSTALAKARFANTSLPSAFRIQIGAGISSRRLRTSSISSSSCLCLAAIAA